MREIFVSPFRRTQSLPSRQRSCDERGRIRNFARTRLTDAILASRTHRAEASRLCIDKSFEKFTIKVKARESLARQSRTWLIPLYKAAKVRALLNAVFDFFFFFATRFIMRRVDRRPGRAGTRLRRERRGGGRDCDCDFSMIYIRAQKCPSYRFHRYRRALI